MKKKNTRADHIRDAADAMSDLNVMGFIVEAIESSGVFNSEHACKAAERITSICKGSIQQSLNDYDRHVAAASK